MTIQGRRSKGILKNRFASFSLALMLASFGSALIAQSPCGDPPRFFDPEVEIQTREYDKERKSFRTKLIRQGPSPQEGKPIRPPEGAFEVEFASGEIRLKAWINKPLNSREQMPAVLFLHGGFAIGEDDWKMSEPYRKAGFVVMTPILRGENGQPGSFSMFYNEVEDVLAAERFLRKQSFIDKDKIYLAGHSAGGTLALLTAEASSRFRAAASFDASPDQQLLFSGAAQRPWVPKEVVFDRTILAELRVRSPLAYVYSIKIPTRLYYSSEASCLFERGSLRTAKLAKNRRLDVEAIKIEGTHFSHVPLAIAESIRFFQKDNRRK